MKTIKVLFLAAEADPLVKIGGLGDVAGSLPRALEQLSPEKTGGAVIEARLVIPYHAAIRSKFPDPKLLCEFEVPSKNGPIAAQAYWIQDDGDTFLIAGEPIDVSTAVYDADATLAGRKFFFFSLAALEMVKKLGWQPDILHANDWHTALAVYALELIKANDPFFKNIHSVFTLHNLPFMGIGTEEAFDSFGLPPSQDPRLPWWAKKLPLPLGLQVAERIVAVSPSYARGILTPEYGCGLEEFLKTRQNFIAGILNGLDPNTWNPATDPYIPQNFTLMTLANRQENKSALIKEFSLDPDPNIPLLILISRMDPQKGIDLAIEGLVQTVAENWQAIFLGAGDPQLEDACQNLEKAYPERIRVINRFDSQLSRRMYAGGDILLMPSRYEPCGLAQMIAMRYGCVPLARATGGLLDTVIDIAEGQERGTGFLFTSATPIAFAETLRRALAVFPNRERWRVIQMQGMRQDFSWENSALEYVKLYQDLILVRA